MTEGPPSKPGYRLRGESWTTSSHWIVVTVTLIADDADELSALTTAELQKHPRAIDLLERASGDEVIEVRNLEILPIEDAASD